MLTTREVAMDILGIANLFERICVDTDATFFQEDEVLQNKLHDFPFCPPGDLPPEKFKPRLHHI